MSIKVRHKISIRELPKAQAIVSHPICVTWDIEFSLLATELLLIHWLTIGAGTLTVFPLSLPLGQPVQGWDIIGTGRGYRFGEVP